MFLVLSKPATVLHVQAVLLLHLHKVGVTRGHSVFHNAHLCDGCTPRRQFTTTILVLLQRSPQPYLPIKALATSIAVYCKALQVCVLAGLFAG